MDETDTTLGETAEDFYKTRCRERTGPVELARRISDITLPSLFPPEEWRQGDDLEITNQSIGAYLINTLASNLTLAALPPNLPMAKFEAVEEKLSEDIQQDPELWAKTIYALSRKEIIHRKRLERTRARSNYGRAMRLLLVTGNCCVKWIDLDEPITYDMHQYVVKRAADGEPLVTVIEESIPYATADDDIQQAAETAWADSGISKDDKQSDWDKNIHVYHVQKLVVTSKKREWLYWQEVEGGTVVEGSEAWAPYEYPHLYPGGLIHRPGADWHLPYCVDYEGDLMAIENLESALQDAAAAMAWFLYFVASDGNTNINDVRKADNLDVVPGRADDVSVLRTDKSGDVGAVLQQAERVARRLGIAFASRAALQRQGERVTAEEWQVLVQELDRAMGGLYSQISDGIHRWFVGRAVYLHELEAPDLKPKPAGLIDVRPNTGMDAIGQSSDHANLKGFITDAIEAVGPEGIAEEVNRRDLLQRLASFRGVKLEGLLRSSEEIAAERQQQTQQLQQQTLLEQAAGPIAKEGAGALTQMMMEQGNAQNE